MMLQASKLRAKHFAKLGLDHETIVPLGRSYCCSLVRPNLVGEPFQITVEDLAHHHFHHGLAQ
jgi:hypothetical protein